MTSQQAIYIACSGGVDSVVLSHYIKHNNPEHIPLYMVHINHGYRAEAHDEALFVQAYAASLTIDCHIINLALSDGDVGNKMHQARIHRYNAMMGYMKHHTPNWQHILATAHHYDDVWEGFFLRLQRQSALRGLQPMTTHDELRLHNHSIAIWRPLLSWKKAAIYAYAHHHKLSWMEDATNKDTHYNRNLIRHLTTEMALDTALYKPLQDMMHNEFTAQHHHIEQVYNTTIHPMNLGYNMPMMAYNTLQEWEQWALWHYFFSRHSVVGYSPKHAKIMRLHDMLKQGRHKTLGFWRFIPKGDHYHIVPE